MCTLLETSIKKDNCSGDVLSTSMQNWQMWCRLCAKEDIEGNVCVLFKDEQTGRTTTTSTSVESVSGSDIGRSNNNSCLVDSLEKYFCVQITCDDILPKMLCTECFSLVTSLVNFSERVVKVQQMFLTLKDTLGSSDVDTHAIRIKYGLLDEDRGNVLLHKPLPEIHYLETTINNNKSETEHDHDELPIVNPLEHPRIKIKIKKEKISAYVRAEDNKNENCDEYYDEYPFDNDEEFIFTKENPESADSDRLNDDTNVDGKGELVNIKEHDIKDTLKTHTRNRRKREKRNYNENDANDGKKESDKSAGSKEVIPCTECSCTFKRIKGLERHMDRAHSGNLPVEDLTCTHCSHVFKSKYKLKKHLTIHLSAEEKKTEPCSYCDKKFATKIQLQLHVKHVHNDERPFVCDKCGVAKRTRGALNEHMASHTSYAPFKCEVCGKQFKAKYRLKLHMDIHDPNKHICSKCGLQLNSRRTLRSHLLVHSDNMRHKCDYCGRAFKLAKTLKCHLISHTGIKPYSCNFCDRAFSNGANCRLHMNKIHPEEVAVGGLVYTLNMPKMETLKAISKTADNLAPVPSGPTCKEEAPKVQKDS